MRYNVFEPGHSDLYTKPPKIIPPQPQTVIDKDGLPTYHRWESPSGPRSIFYDVHVMQHRLRLIESRNTF